MRRGIPASWILAAFAGTAMFLLACGGGGPGEAGEDGGGASNPPPGQLLPVILFFPGAGETLVKEERTVATGTAEEQVRAIVLALLEGPASPAGQAALPKDVTLAGVYLGSAGVAYLDLHRPDSQSPPPMGSLQETLMVYSLVNSVALNVQEVERVSLMWNGAQRPSLAGHLDNGGPLAPRPQLAR